MSPELKDLLDDAARRPRRSVDVDDLHRRARRRRSTEVAAAVAGVALLIGGVAVGVSELAEGPARAPFIDGRDGTPSDPPSASAPDRDGVVTAGDLDAEVFVAVDDADGGEGHVLRLLPHGGSFPMPVRSGQPSQLPIEVDDLGGFAYQETGELVGGAPPIHEVWTTGSGEVLVPATGPGESLYRLVGRSDAGYLVAHTSGTTPDDTVGELLEFRHGGESRVVSTNTSGWESAVVSAVSLEVTVYVLAELSGTSIVVDPPDREPTVVWRSDEATGEEAVDVDIIGSDGAFALVRTPGGAQLLSIDLFAAEPDVPDRVEVPLGLGTDATDVQATEISIHTHHILVNRQAAGEWLPPLVHDLSAPGTWSVFERPGRALLARAVPADDVVEPPCASDDGLRNAPPDDDTLHRYLLCAGGEQMHADAYRHPSGLEPSGDPATDARAVLDLVLGDLDPELEARGYVDVAATANGSIGVHDVRFSDGTLVVDFDFPDGGVGNLGTATGGAMWSTFVRANLLQLDGVEVLELHANGSCEAYTTSFEGSGCLRHTPADAPWSSSG